MRIFYFGKDKRFIGEDTIPDGAMFPTNATDVEIPEGMFDPVFDPENNTWSDAATDEYKKEVQPGEQEPNELQIIKKDYSDLLYTLMVGGVI